MKRFVLMLVVLTLLSCNAFAEDIYVSSDTVSYNTVAVVATFNSVTTSVLVSNESSGIVYVNLTGLGWTLYHDTYINPSTQSQGVTNSVVRLEPNSSLSLDLQTDKIGWLSETGDGTLKFVVTSDKGQL